MSKFILESEYSPSRDQPKAIKEVQKPTLIIISLKPTALAANIKPTDLITDFFEKF